jgi:hypothetical protein
MSTTSFRGPLLLYTVARSTFDAGASTGADADGTPASGDSALSEGAVVLSVEDIVYWTTKSEK